MDVCGPYPTNRSGNKYVLVVTEYLTKWVECWALRDQKAETIARSFEQYVARHGVPEAVLTDQGRNFESNLFRHLCAKYGIEKRSTTGYHPQCNGLTERFNNTMNTMFTNYVNDNQDDWDEWLPSVLLAYRTAEH